MATSSYQWQPSERDSVSLDVTWTGRKSLTLNGALLETFRGKVSEPFFLSDGSSASLKCEQPFGAPFDPQLWVKNKKAYRIDPHELRTCHECGAVAKPYDDYCEACGTQLLNGDTIFQKERVTEASKSIAVLAWLFSISGVVMFFIQKNTATEALANLEGLPDDQLFSEPVGGEIVTVGELRQMVEWEPMGVLLVNFVLAVIMAFLYFWGKRSPLPAMLVATSTYLAVIILNAIIDPTTLAQGIIIKVIVILALARGIKAALASREVQPAPA